MASGFVGRPWHEVEQELQSAGIRYEKEITRPTRDFFKVDEKYLYVLRERQSPEGSLQFVLAARCTGVLPG
ncbi:MAG: RNA-3-phosphate cyclase [Selenomonadaceae bacterium]|nr:RNA-3-phosphate cyclase [Selenomonadaceae bacterium]